MVERTARVLLAVAAAPYVLVGAWALAAPRRFYDSFPGLGRHWVDLDGPYNEHLVRDVGHLNLALAVVLVAGVVLGYRALVATGALAALVSAAPHLLYHALNRDGFSTADQVLSLASLAVGVLVPAVVLWLALSRPPVHAVAEAVSASGR